MGYAKYVLNRLVILPFFIVLFNVLYLIKVITLNAFRLFVKSEFATVVRTPAECFKDLDILGYPFAPHYVELPIGGGKTLPRVHYVDEGPRDARETVLCLHGEPSWSFLYRKMVPGLVAAGHRVIVPDFIGFGKSDKYTHPEAYTHAMHTMTLRLLLDHLKVKGVTLVCQDWGGLTGLTVVQECPQVFSRLVIMNTGLPAGEHFSIMNISRFIPFITWRSFALMVGTWMPIRFVFKSAMKTVSDKVLEGYCAPFPASSYKAGAAKWPLLVPVHTGSPVAGDMKRTKTFLTDKWRQPALIMFSNNDAITKGEVPGFMRMLPHAKQVTINGGYHFLQEEKGEELATNVVEFIKESQ